MNKEKQINESSFEREEAIEEGFSAGFLLQLINGTSDPIFVKNRQHCRVLVNDAYCNFISRSREEIIGKSDFDLFDDRVADEIWEQDEFIFTTSNQNESDECITDDRGNRRFVSIKKCVFKDEEDNKFIIVTIRELTEQINQHFQMEKRLRSSKQSLEKVLDNIPLALFWKDCDSVYQGCNQFFAEIAGVGEPKLIKGKTDFDLPWKEEEVDWFRLSDSRAIESKIPESIIKPQTQADGRQCWLEINTIPICDEQGKVVNVLGTLRDITESKEIEVALQQLYEDLEIRVHQRTSELTKVVSHLQKEIKQREAIESQFRLSEERLQKLSANVPGMLFQFKLGADNKFSFPYVSSGVEEIYEFPPERIINDASLFISCVHRDEREGFEKSIATSAQSLQPWRWEGRIILTTGKVKWIQAASRPEQQQDGAIVWDGVVMDVTPLKQAERALKRAYADLEQRVEERTQQLMQSNQALHKEVGDRHSVQSELLTSRQRLSLLIEQTPLAVIEWDTDFRVKEWNQAAERIFGYTKEQAIGSHFEFIVSQTAQEQINYLTATLLSQRNGTPIINENVTKNGKTIVCEWYNNPLVAENGEVISVASMVLDISQREQTQTALREQEQFLRNIYQGVEELIFVINVLDNNQFIYADWNSATEKATGINASDAISKSPQEVFGDVQGAKIHQQYIRCLEAGISISYEENLSFQAQQKSWWLTTLSPLRNTDGKIYRIVGTSSDISDRKHAETQLKQQAQELAVALNQLQDAQMQLVRNKQMSSLGNLVARVAHEMNNPVNFIYGGINNASNYTQDLLKLIRLYQQSYPQASSDIQELTEEINLEFLLKDLPKLLDSMNVKAQSIREIVAFLHTFSRIDKTKLKKVDIHQGLDSALMIIENRIKAKPEHSQIEIIKEYGNLPLLECYPEQIKQVFTNILTNALDALEESILKKQMNRNPQIRIRTELIESNKVTIHIADNGIGIPEHIKGKLFEPFFTTKPVSKGTGIGLSSSYQIIAQIHGGSIECISKSGEGSKFTISIPLYQGS